jgi:AsmA protein
VSRVIRRSLIVMVVLAALIVLAAAALPFLVDVNRYRPLIVAGVQEATGRTLTLGAISFTLLPAPGLRVGGPIVISDSAAYPGRSALTAESLSVRLGLLGLLRGRASVTSIALHRPTLTLIRDARGRWNFDDLVARASAAPPAQAAGAGETGGLGVVVHNARVISGRVIVYDDAVQPGRRAQATIAPIDATILGWGGDDPTDLDLSAGVGKSLLRAQARLSARGEAPHLTLQAGGHRLRAEDFATLLPWLGVARPAGLQVSGSIDLEGSAEVPIERPESLRFKGNLVLDGLSYRDAGMALPLKGLSGRLTVDGDRAVWKNFKVSAGSSSLVGTLQVEDFMRPRIGFTLTSPRVDLNEIIATLVPAAPAGAAPAAAASGAVPTGILDQISGAGRLEVKQVRFQTFDLSNVSASMSLAKSVFTLKDLGASLYGGSLRGSASVDLARAVPRYALAARLSGIDVDPLIAAYDPTLKDLLRGRLAGNLDLGASGARMDAILDTARGTGAVELVDGSLTSFSVLKQLAALLELAGGKGIGKESTPFESLKAGLAIADGRARTDDLTLHSTDLDLEGKGWVGLDAKLDLNVTARFSEESTRGMVEKNARLGGLTVNDRMVISFALKGDLANPTFRLDTHAQVETAKEKAKEKLRERVRDRLLKQLVPAQPEEEKP